MTASALSGLLAPDAELQGIFDDAAIDPTVEAIIGNPDNEWVISRRLAQFLSRLVMQTNRCDVLEYGAGSSSLVLATALAHRGTGRLTSIEHQPEYSRDSWTRVEELLSVDARLIVSPLRLTLSRYGLLYGYSGALKAVRERAPYDLLLIDAPPGNYGRDAPLYQALPFLKDGAFIVLDDAGRAREQTTVRRWLATFPGLRLVLFDFSGRGTAVLNYTGDKRRRFAARGVLGSFHDQITYR
jgi:predicted O-methyltransferase YrrM